MLAYEMEPRELRQKLDEGASLQLLDVREPWETEKAPFPGAVQMPMGDVPSRAFRELDPDDPVVVICHHGVRSLNVTNWLRNQGYEHAQSLRGGIDEWARSIDPQVGRY